MSEHVGPLASSPLPSLVPILSPCVEAGQRLGARERHAWVPLLPGSTSQLLALFYIAIKAGEWSLGTRLMRGATVHGHNIQHRTKEHIDTLSLSPVSSLIASVEWIGITVRGDWRQTHTHSSDSDYAKF